MAPYSQSMWPATQDRAWWPGRAMSGTVISYNRQSMPILLSLSAAMASTWLCSLGVLAKGISQLAWKTIDRIQLDNLVNWRIFLGLVSSLFRRFLVVCRPGPFHYNCLRMCTIDGGFKRKLPQIERDLSCEIAAPCGSDLRYRSIATLSVWVILYFYEMCFTNLS